MTVPRMSLEPAANNLHHVVELGTEGSTGPVTIDSIAAG